MKVIQVGKPISQIKRLTCSGCGTIFEFTKSECSVTSQFGVIHDGLGNYNINCPVCNSVAYFDWGA